MLCCTGAVILYWITSPCEWMSRPPECRDPILCGVLITAEALKGVVIITMASRAMFGGELFR